MPARYRPGPIPSRGLTLWGAEPGRARGGEFPLCSAARDPPPLAVVGSGDGAGSVCLVLGTTMSSDDGCQVWMERAGGRVGWVGATFPWGLSSSRVARFGSGGISVCAGMTAERGHVKGVLQSPALGPASCAPQGDQGSQSLGSGGNHLCLAGAGWKLLLG